MLCKMLYCAIFYFSYNSSLITNNIFLNKNEHITSIDTGFDSEWLHMLIESGNKNVFTITL